MRPLFLAALLLAIALPARAVKGFVFDSQQRTAPRTQCAAPVPLKSFAACVANHKAELWPSPSPKATLLLGCRVGGLAGPIDIRLLGVSGDTFAMIDDKMARCRQNSEVFKRFRQVRAGDAQASKAPPAPGPGGASGDDPTTDLKYVHAVAVLHAAPVAGIEAPSSKKVEGLWELAWETGTNYLPKDQIVLVSEAQKFRDQHQLHVHVLKFADGARERFLKAKDDKHLDPIAIADLKQVWDKAEEQAKKLERKLAGKAADKDADQDKSPPSKPYGIVVAQKDKDGEFGVTVVMDESAEKSFGMACSDDPCAR